MKNAFKDAPIEFYLRGDIIEVKDDDDVYYVESGLLGFYVGSDKNDSNVIFIYRPGDVFPLLGRQNRLIKPGPVKYKALANTSLRHTNRAHFEEIAFSPKHTKQTFDELLKMTNYLFDRVFTLSHVSVEKRLIYRLIYLADRIGTAYDQRVIIDFPQSHSDLAAGINTSRETVNRLMKKLEKDGLLVVKNQNIIINSLDKLKQRINSTKA